MSYFTIVKGPTPGAILPLSGKSEIIGRSTECSVMLEVPSISRRHARFYLNDGRAMLEDLNSRNGTSVNDVRLTAPVELHDGDQVQLCDIVMTFHTGTSSQAQAESVKIIDSAPEMNIESSFRMDGQFGMDASAVDQKQEELHFKLDQAHTTQRPGGEKQEKSRSQRLFETFNQLEEVDDDKSSVLSSISVSPFEGTSSRSGIHAATKLRAILQLMKNLGQNLDLDEVMEKILDSLFVIFPNAEDGLIVLLGESADTLIPMAVKHRHPTAAPIRISRTVFSNVINGKTAALSADVLNDERFNHAQSVVNMSSRSMMCAPLIDADGNALGAIKLDSDEMGKRFKPEDLELLASVAVQAALYVRNAQLHVLAMKEVALDEELKMAHRIQKCLLPEKAPDVEGYSFFDVYLPARHLGGDYYDYFPLPDGTTAIIQADVSGKGVTASLLMAKLCADVRFSLMTVHDPIEAVTLLNKIVCSKDLDGKFITLVLVLLDSKNNTVTIVNAGHNPPISRKADGTTELIQLGGGLPLGISEGIPYEALERKIEPGETLFFYTDGLTDAVNERGEFFGIENAMKKTSEPAASVAECGASLMSHLKEYIGNAKQTDDICVVGFQRTGENP